MNPTFLAASVVCEVDVAVRSSIATISGFQNMVDLFANTIKSRR